MRQKMLTRRRVTFTHTRTHTSVYQRVILITLMLFFLMLKTDVGWGQCGSNHITNPNFVMGPPCNIAGSGYNGSSSFETGCVEGWYRASATPHHAIKNPMSYSDVLCDIFNLPPVPYDGSEFPCIGNYEGIFQDVRILENPNLSFEFSLDVQGLICEHYQPGNTMEILISKDINDHIPFFTLLNFPRQSLLTHTITDDVPETLTIPFTVQPGSGFNQIWIRNVYPGIQDGNFTFRNAILTCNTHALTDIQTDIAEKKVDFSFDNSDQSCPFATYSWDFGDPLSGSQNNYSTVSNPSHEFSDYGTFNVCLEITDCNGCCGQLCKEVVITDIPMCGRDQYPDYYLLDGTNAPLVFSQWAAQNGYIYPVGTTPIMSNKNFVVKGTVIIDKPYFFFQCDFINDAGVEIQIMTNRKGSNTLFSTCNFSACDVMWKGIRVINANTIFVANIIRDAEYGVHVENYGNVSFQNNKFYDNVIGIYLTSTASHTIKQNVFEGLSTSNRPAYPGQLLYRIHPHAGIWFSGTPSAYVGTATTLGGNVFRKMANGILAEKTTLSCYGNQFINIDNFGLPALLDIHEPTNPLAVGRKGVWLLSGTNHHISKNIFESGSASTAILFKDGISTDFNVSGNSIKGHGDGVVFNGVSNSRLYINNHNPSSFTGGEISVDAGIKHYTNNSGNYFEINDNTFKDNQSFSTYMYNSHGRFISSMLRNNFIVTTSRPVTRTLNRFLSVDNTYVQNNNFETNDQLLTDVYLSTSNYFKIKDNFIWNLNANKQNFGIDCATNIAQSQFQCNILKNMNVGFSFKGNNNSGIDFATNLMDENTTGIKIKDRFTAQTDKGNLWVGANSKAENQGSGIDRWYVNPNQPAPVAVPGAKFKPDIVIPTIWFRSDDIIASTCFGNTQDSLSESEYAVLQAKEIASNILDNIPDTEWMVWEWQTALKQLSEDYPNIGSEDPLIAQALTSIPAAVTSYLEKDKELATILELSETERDQLQTVRNALNNLLVQKEGLVEEAIQDSIRAEELDDSILLLGSQIQALQQTQASAEQNYTNRKATELVQFKSSISSLPETEAFHSAMKTMLEIKADLYAYGMAYVSLHDMDALKDISDLCYEKYGRAAAEAAELLDIMGEDGSINYDDCVELHRKTLIVDDGLKAIPNPASDKIHVSCGETNIVSLRFINGQGSVVETNLDGGQNVDVSSIPTGVYIIEATLSDQSVKTTKFIKVK